LVGGQLKFWGAGVEKKTTGIAKQFLDNILNWVLEGGVGSPLLREEADDGVGNECLTSMGEQSDTGFRWQEIELHEHAKLHHFGTTVNNFPFAPSRSFFFFPHFIFAAYFQPNFDRQIFRCLASKHPLHLPILVNGNLCENINFTFFSLVHSL